MKTMSTILEQYLKANASYKVLREKYQQQSASLVSAKQAVRRLERDLEKQTEDMSEVLGTNEEEVALSNLEILKANLGKARTRSNLLEGIANRGNNGLEKLSSLRRIHYQRLLYFVVQAELAQFPEEARAVLAHALSVANMMDGGWDELLKATLKLPIQDQKLAQLGRDVIASHIPELASGGR